MIPSCRSGVEDYILLLGTKSNMFSTWSPSWEGPYKVIKSMFIGILICFRGCKVLVSQKQLTWCIWKIFSKCLARGFSVIQTMADTYITLTTKTTVVYIALRIKKHWTWHHWYFCHVFLSSHILSLKTEAFVDSKIWWGRWWIKFGTKELIQIKLDKTSKTGPVRYGLPLCTCWFWLMASRAFGTGLG